MINLKYKLILILSLIFFFTGCFDYKELDDLSIVTAVAIDKVESGYEISYSIANAKKAQVSSKEGESQTTVFSGVGPTLSEAMREIDLKNPRSTYLGHVSVIVMSSDIAKEGVFKVVDLFMRDPESRKKFFFLITRDQKAKDVVKVLSPLEAFPSQNIVINLQNSSTNQSISTNVGYSQFIRSVLRPGVDPVLPSIIISGDSEEGSNMANLENSEPKTYIELSNLGIFKEDKLVGFAKREESRGINIINGNAKNVIVTTKCDGNNFANANITNIRVNRNYKIDKNQPSIDIDVTTDGSLQEINCAYDLLQPGDLKKITKKFEDSLHDMLQSAISTAQNKYKSDIFGFGLYYYRYHPDYFKHVQSVWDDDVFPYIKVNIDVSINLETKGALNETIQKEEDVRDEKTN